MKLQQYISDKLLYSINENIKNAILLAGSDRWFNIRVVLLNYLLVQIPCYILLIYQLYDEVDSVKIAMIILYATNISMDSINALTIITFLETNFIAVERATNFEKIEPEEGYQNISAERKLMTTLSLDPKKLNCSDYAPKHIIIEEKIVKNGLVEFRNVFARYPGKENDVLKDLNFVIQPGEKIGVVGKTAAGKTSLIKLFWRCLEVYKGQILIDNKDISKCDLKVLRSEMDIVSQNVAIFAGTLRENLNPGDANDKKDDEKLINILRTLEFNNGTDINLDMVLDSSGSNLSTGEAQIISFARILLTKRKLVILDEATANIDLRTENVVQTFLNKGFETSTMFIIAHRLQTVMHCDRIMVLEYGRVIQFDTPQNLIDEKNGYFREMFKRMIKE